MTGTAPASGNGDPITFETVNGNALGAGIQYNNTQITPARAAPRALKSLPPEAVRLIGRREQAEELLELLRPAAEAPAAVVVSAVAGLAGIGKSALALHVAHRAAAEGWFPGGTVFLDLHGYDPTGLVTPQQALTALLHALGTTAEDLPPSVEEQGALYRTILADLAARKRPLLLLLDNASAEHQVLPLLPGHRAHRVLTTSRHILAGLPARLIGLDTLTPADAATLIAQTLLDARPEDPRPHAEAEALARVAALCGHLPLALQIVAALLNSDPQRPIAALAADLADTRTRVTKLRYHDGDGRSLAVQSAFDLSYHRLDPERARIFRLLSLPQGPDISLEVAAALVAAPAADVRPHLAALAQAHLLEPVGTDRWRAHDLIRIYATELTRHTDDHDTLEQALDRFLNHYTTTADAAAAHLRALAGSPVPDRFNDRTHALQWFDNERPTLIASTAQALTTGRHLTAMALADCTAGYLHWRRRFDDAHTSATLALDAARQSADRQGEGTALNNLGLALRKVRRFEEAIDAHQEAATIYRETADRHGEGIALNNLGNALQEARRFEEAIDAQQQNLAICRDTADRQGEGTALNNLGIALQEVRRFEEAIDAHQEAAAICRETADRHGEGIALNNLGSALLEVRRFEEAIDAHQASSEIYRETADRHSEGTALNNLGLALQEVHRFEEAINAHQRDLAICRDTADRHGEGTALNNLGIALRRMDRFGEAIDAHQQAAAIFRETTDRHSEGIALNNLALALQEMQRPRIGRIRGIWQRLRAVGGTGRTVFSTVPRRTEDHQVE